MALIELEQVTKTYRMGDVDVHALRGVSLAIGEPYVVPPDIDDDGLEAWRKDLERRLAVLEARARDLLHEP